MNTTTDRNEWLEARRALLAREKAHTRAQDALCEARRALPVLKVATDYAFDTERGRETLSDLFAGRGQLVVYHFMFGKDWDEGCPTCSFWADNMNGVDVHLAARDTTLVLCSNAPLATLLGYRERLGWSLDWVSTAAGSRFSQDFGVTFDGSNSEGYNYAERVPSGELPGLSAFVRLADGGVGHSYSTYGRGVESFNGGYHLLDLTHKGRDEGALAFTQAWIRRRDAY